MDAPDVREAAEALLTLVEQMRVPQTTADAGLQVLQFAPAVGALRAALAQTPDAPDRCVAALVSPDEAVRCPVCGDYDRTRSDCRDAWHTAPVSPPAASRDAVERLAEEVRIAWVAWARTQPNPKPSWLVPWAELDEQSKDADRAIARRLLALYAAPLPAAPAHDAVGCEKCGGTRLFPLCADPTHADSTEPPSSGASCVCRDPFHSVYVDGPQDSTYDAYLRHVADDAVDPDAPVKCGTFGGVTIPPDVRARMDADRAAAERVQSDAVERAAAAIYHADYFGGDTLPTLDFRKDAPFEAMAETTKAEYRLLARAALLAAERAQRDAGAEGDQRAQDAKGGDDVR